MAKIVAVCVSKARGVKKQDVGKAILREGYGIVGDGHGGTGRQVSLLAIESIEKMRNLGVEVGPGDMAENLTTKGIDLVSLPIGAQLRIGEEILAQVSQIGKECHDHCQIYEQVGTCVMPKEGIFIEVLKGGEVRKGDAISVLGGAEEA